MLQVEVWQLHLSQLARWPPQPHRSPTTADRPENSSTSVDANLHDLAVDTAAVVEEIGRGGPAVVVGHAFGQRVCRTLASDRPDLVSAVIMIAAGGKVPPSEEAVAALRACFDLSLPQETRMEFVRSAFFAEAMSCGVARRLGTRRRANADSSVGGHPCRILVGGRASPAPRHTGFAGQDWLFLRTVAFCKKKWGRGWSWSRSRGRAILCCQSVRRRSRLPSSVS